MPNRKTNTGWYLLPRSETPYYGTLPDGEKGLTETEAKAAAKKAASKTSGEPAGTKPGDPEGAKS